MALNSGRAWLVDEGINSLFVALGRAGQEFLDGRFWLDLKKWLLKPIGWVTLELAGVSPQRYLGRGRTAPF